MKTNNSPKKENVSADILVNGLLASDGFFYVSEKKFYSALCAFGYKLMKDSRLKETKKVETFYVCNIYMRELRKYGINTPLIGYKRYNSYSLHEKLYNLIRYGIDVHESVSVQQLIDSLDILEFYQEKEYANKVGLS